MNSFPSLNSDTQAIKQGFYFFYYFSHFEKTSSITLQNNATIGTNEKAGSYDPNIPSQLMANYQILFPISNNWFAKSMGVSFIAPIPEFIIIDSTSSFLPKYYWYDSKLNKTELFVHIMQKWSDHWDSAISVKGNWNVSSQSEMITGLQGSGTPSSGRIQGKTKPYFIPQVSLLWKNLDYKFHVSIIPSSKQILKNYVIGKAPIGGATNVDYSFTLNSNSHFEPFQIKFDFSSKMTTSLDYSLGLTYEDWSNIPSCVLEITDVQGSVTASNSYEKIRGKKIVSPALGIDYYVNDSNILNLSYRFKPKTINKDNATSGNTIDNEAHIVGLGLIKKFDDPKIAWPDVVSAGIQFHYLPTSNISKTNLQEDSSAGHKIGYPGYKAGGFFSIFSIGVNYSF